MIISIIHLEISLRLDSQILQSVVVSRGLSLQNWQLLVPLIIAQLYFVIRLTIITARDEAQFTQFAANLDQQSQQITQASAVAKNLEDIVSSALNTFESTKIKLIESQESLAATEDLISRIEKIINVLTDIDGTYTKIRHDLPDFESLRQLGDIASSPRSQLRHDLELMSSRVSDLVYTTDQTRIDDLISWLRSASNALSEILHVSELIPTYAQKMSGLERILDSWKVSLDSSILAGSRETFQKAQFGVKLEKLDRFGLAFLSSLMLGSFSFFSGLFAVLHQILS